MALIGHHVPLWWDVLMAAFCVSLRVNWINHRYYCLAPGKKSEGRMAHLGSEKELTYYLEEGY
jgi:hypothetical protein